MEHGLCHASASLHDMPGTVSDLDPSNEIIALFCHTGVHIQSVFTHQGREVFRKVQRCFPYFLCVHNPVTVGIVEPRVPQVRHGVRRKVGPVSHRKGKRCARRDVAAVKAFNGTAHQGGCDVVKEECEASGQVIDNILTTQRNNLDTEVKGRASKRDGIGEQRHSLIEDRRRGVFIAVNKETNEGLT